MRLLFIEANISRDLFVSCSETGDGNYKLFYCNIYTIMNSVMTLRFDHLLTIYFIYFIKLNSFEIYRACTVLLYIFGQLRFNWSLIVWYHALLESKYLFSNFLIINGISQCTKWSMPRRTI